MDWEIFEDIVEEKWSEGATNKSDVFEACEAAYLLGQKVAGAEVTLDRVVSCEHLLGTYDRGIGSDTVLVYDDGRNEGLLESPDFYPFDYCALCGAKLSN